MIMSFHKEGHRCFTHLGVSKPLDKLFKWDVYGSKAKAWSSALGHIKSENCK